MGSPLAVVSASTPASYLVHSQSMTVAANAVVERARQLWCLGDSNGPCANCRKLAGGTQTDLISVSPSDKPSIGIETVRSLVKSLSLSVASDSSLRVVHISPADQLTTEAQNALLKLMEEPPARTLVLLSTTQPEALLPTIRSRCQTVFIPADATSATPGVATAASALLSATPFDRLVQARKLTEAKTDMFELSRTMQKHILANATSTPDAATLRRQIAALEQFRRHMSAGVGARAALETMVLEL